MKGRALTIEKTEWDFSDIEISPFGAGDFANWWEYMREGALAAGLAPIPPPWLSIEEGRRPIFSGGFRGSPPLIPFREVPATYQPDAGYGESGHVIAINWCYSKSEILRSIGKWLDDQRPPGSTREPGRVDTKTAELWDLAIYRLRRTCGLSVEGCQDLFRKTALKDRRLGLFGRNAARDFSAAACRASRRVERLKKNFLKDDLPFRALTLLWKASH